MGRIIPLKSVTISCCRYQPLLQFFSAAKLLGSPASTCRQIKPSGWEIINLAILCFKRYCIHVLMCVYFLVVCLELGQLEVCSIWWFGGARKMRGCTSWMCARVWWVSFQKMKFQLLCTSVPQCISMYLHIAEIVVIFNVHLIKLSIATMSRQQFLVVLIYR